jgi:hypothetical protein
LESVFIFALRSLFLSLTTFAAWTTSSGNAAAFATIQDPNNNFAIEMHQYLDTDGSGTNATCLSPAIGAQRLSAATEWLQENGYKGFLGEIGAGNNGQLSSLLGVIRITATDTLLPSLQTSVPRLSTSRCAAWPSRAPGWASAGGLLARGGGTCLYLSL